MISADWEGNSKLNLQKNKDMSRQETNELILVQSSTMSSDLGGIVDNICFSEIFLSFSNNQEKLKIAPEKKN